MREIAKTTNFTNNLKQLSRKYPELKSTVEDALKKYAATGATPSSDRIPGLDGHPVFKERLPLRNTGRRGGARIIYFCDSDRVLALFLYVKTDQADVPTKEIREALKSADVL